MYKDLSEERIIMKARQFQSREMWLSDLLDHIKIILVYSERAGVVNPSMLLMGVAWSCFLMFS